MSETIRVKFKFILKEKMRITIRNGLREKEKNA